jgi:hypothetical protein
MPHPRPSPVCDIIHLMFDAAAGSQIFTDEGSAGSVWTPSTAVSGKCEITANNVVEGIGAFYTELTLVPDNENHEYIATPYTAANAITSGDFFIGFWLRPSDTQLTNRFMFGVTDTDTDPANTGFYFYTTNGGRLVFRYSDGVTEHEFDIAGVPPTNTQTYICVERIGNTIYGSKNGSSVASAAISGALHLPVGQELHIGAGVNAAHQTFGSCTVDMMQVRRQSVFGGLAFTPPTTAIPC